MGPTEALATFAVRMDGSALPEVVVAAARRAIIDCLGVALAGSVEPTGRIITAQACQQGGAPECTLWAVGGRVSAQNAALANGVLAHALDYDDTSRSIPDHPSAVVLPAVVAAAERKRATGLDLLAAFVAGMEVQCKLGKWTGQESFDRGWHTTTTIGIFGATAGVGRLMGLDAPAVRRALGIALSLAGGVRQNFGTMVKPLHVGRAAQSAIFAVELARRGFTASGTPIEGQFGYWEMFGGAENRDGDALAAALGRPFDLVDPGLNFKLYPCCAGTHPAIDVALDLRPGLPPAEISGVVVDAPYTAPLVLIHHRPTTSLEAKFSLEYCVAAALLDGRVGLEQFTEESVARREVQALLRRVQLRVPNDWQKGAGPLKVGHARVEVRLRDGAVHRGETAVPRGSAQNPMTDDELESKFMSCAALAMDAAGARRILDLVHSLERLREVRQLTEALVGPASKAVG